ncbi:MAG: serine O-acetyltransferase [Porticoccaceae bacterium]
MTDALWHTIKQEITQASIEEPPLAGYFHAAVLSHDSLESALAYVLARLLGNQVVSPLTLHQVIEEGFAADADIGHKMRRDLCAHYERDPACDRYYIPLLYFKGFHALQAHRLSHWLWQRGRTSMALYIQSRVSEALGVDIHPAVKIGAGLMIDHATGIVIGETAVIGDDVSMLHSVTLGGTGNETGDRHPKIGRGVLIAAGAKILGNIHVGTGAKIGAGSLVLDSVKPHTTVAGVPAKVVGKQLGSMAALDMDQSFSSSEG